MKVCNNEKRDRQWEKNLSCGAKKKIRRQNKAQPEVIYVDNHKRIPDIFWGQIGCDQLY